MVLGNQQQLAGARADPLDGRLGGLDAQRQEGVVEVVETAGKEVQVHRRKLEAAVAQVGRSVEGRQMILPLRPHPVLDGGGVVEEVFFQFE